MKIKTLLLIFLFFLLTPVISSAQDNPKQNNEEIFKARVVEIIEQKNVTRNDGSISIQQELKLKGLEGNWKDKEIIFDGTEFNLMFYLPANTK